MPLSDEMENAIRWGKIPAGIMIEYYDSFGKGWAAKDIDGTWWCFDWSGRGQPNFNAGFLTIKGEAEVATGGYKVLGNYLEK